MKVAKPARTEQKKKTDKTVKADAAAKAVKTVMAKAGKAAKKQAAALPEGTLTVKLPRTLRETLQERQTAEGVSMDELVTYLLMRGMARWVED